MKPDRLPLPAPLTAQVCVLSFALLAGAAWAQGTPPAPAAPATPEAPIPKHNCTAPGATPGRLASEVSKSAWTRAMNAYLDCVKDFIAAEQAIAKPLIDASKPHIAAANAAVDDFNAAAKVFREQQEAAAAATK